MAREVCSFSTKHETLLPQQGRGWPGLPNTCAWPRKCSLSCDLQTPFPDFAADSPTWGVPQSWLTLFNPIDCSLPVSPWTIHFQELVRLEPILSPGRAPPSCTIRALSVPPPRWRTVVRGSLQKGSPIREPTPRLAARPGPRTSSTLWTLDSGPVAAGPLPRPSPA